MKHFRKILAALFPVLLQALLVSGPAQCAAPIGQGEAAAQAVNAFALDLYGQIRKPDGNLVFSPYSVSMALAMVCAGARGRTESQIARVLHLNLPQPEVHEAFAALNAQVLAAGNGKTVEINIANALWAEKSYPILKEFLNATKVYTDQRGWSARVPVLGRVMEFAGMNGQGGLRQLDLRHGADAARNAINQWVEEQTRNKIKDLLGPGSVTKDTRLVVTNAVYFKGEWESEFDKKRTKDDRFTLLDGTTVMVPMMNQVHGFAYAEVADLQVLEMPYKGEPEASHKAGDLSMVVLLPSREKRFEDFEGSITLEKLNQWTRNLQTRLVMVFLPRFNMTSEVLLPKPLGKLGMTDAFSPTDADFSGMTGNRELFIAEGIHKAFVETNEQGTEAAASTAVTGFLGTSMPPVAVFRADHPFLFLIRHKPTNCILFLGRVTKP